MSNHMYDTSGHDDIVALLPWFVNRTLESHEHELVAMHLNECAECRREIQLLTSLSESIQGDASDGYTMHADVEKSLASVMNRIDDETQEGKEKASAGRWLQQKADKLFGLFAGLTFPQQGLTALTGVLIAVLGLQLYNGQWNNDFSVLSASDIENPIMRLSVEAIPAADQEQVQSTIRLEIKDFDNAVNIEKNPAGGFIIEFDKTIGVAELSRLVEALENESQIEQVKILP